MNICLNCNKETLNNKFCSRSCATTVNNTVAPKRAVAKHAKTKCLGCDVIVDDRKYCSIACQMQLRSQSVIQYWLNNQEKCTKLSKAIRNFLIKESSMKCSECGWGQINPHTKTLPLEIDHIDGNAENNLKANLRVLCPNCHSMTSTYKGANKTGNREFRKKYYKYQSMPL
jgi:Zn finger protein HypA/HybF involved in hydrogenase expression